MNSGLSEPLQGGGSGADESGSAHGSNTSQRSGGGGGSSLLERIQLQRQREAALQQQQQQQTPQQIQVPNYGETTSSSMPGLGSSPNNYNGSESNFFSSAWSNISQSMETGMNEQNDMESALLAPASGDRLSADNENYSMQNYFMTFVKDVYGLFLRLPVPARVVAVIGLLYIALKLL